MKASIDLDTGLIIESQQCADDATLLSNAKSYSYSNIEIRVLTAVEHDAMIAQRDEAKKTTAQRADEARAKRDGLIAAVAWRYERHARELRLSLTPTDDIAVLDTYVQALADVPLQTGFPTTIIWPTPL